jgi:cytochrome d ubiquinol oxidase subunit I
VLFNPWIIPQYTHAMSGAVVTGAFVMAGVGAYYFLARKKLDYARIFVTVGVVVGLLASVFQLYPSGDLNGQQVTNYQPVKLAAMEGLFKTRQGAELVIIGQPNLAEGRLDNAIVVPSALSFLSYRRWTAEVKGLNAFPADQHPDSIELLYYSYHIMVGLGTFFIAIMALAALLRFWGKRLYHTRWMLWLLLLATPFPFIANTAGWFTTELGRQPWVAYGLLRTVDGSSAHLSAGNVLFTLIGFMGMYLLLGLLYILLIVPLMLRGPDVARAEQKQDAESNETVGLIGHLDIAGEQENH